MLHLFRALAIRLQVNVFRDINLHAHEISRMHESDYPEVLESQIKAEARQAYLDGMRDGFGLSQTFIKVLEEGKVNKDFLVDAMRQLKSEADRREKGNGKI